MIIVLPIEIKIREFLPKLLLSFSILKNSKKNFKIILGSQRDISTKLNLYNCVYLDKGSATIVTWLLEKLKKNGNKIFQLDEEGPISEMDQIQKVYRYPKKVFENVDKFFTWTKKDQIFLKNKTKAKVVLSGHPKFDLLEKNNIKFYNREVAIIKKKYGDFIFFASSFSEDNILSQKIFKKYKRSYLPNRSDLLRQELKKSNERKKNYFFAIQTLNDLAKKNKKLKIIFRPHPLQDIQKVQKRFVNNKNIIINKDLSITSWIIATKLYIHSGCTTSFEAQKLNKNSILLSRKKVVEKNLKYNFGKKIFDVENLERYISKKKNSNKFRMNEILNLKKNVKFSNIFLKELKNTKIIKSSYQLKKHKNNFLIEYIFILFSFIKNIKIFSFISFFLFSGNMLLTKEYKEQKFKNLKINEIKENLKRISDIHKNKSQINVKKISENIFELKII
jgi:surface carbohydrate biosynthesis protein